MLATVLDIQPVKAVGTIYIRVDGVVDPPTAPIQRTRDYYLVIGDINDSSIIVEKSDIIVDGAGHTLLGAGAQSSRGIDASNVDNVTIMDVKIRSFQSGVHLGNSRGCNIYQNSIADNSIGIDVRGTAHGNNIVANNVTDCYEGMTFEDLCHDNLVCHNNFMNSTSIHAWVTTPNRNVFDKGYPFGGNYWSDYQNYAPLIVDLRRGPYQNETGRDGIGDTPRAFGIGDNNTDRYPLMDICTYNDDTRLEILPANNTFIRGETSPGSTFSVWVAVENVTDLQGWQVKLSWDPILLNFSRIERPVNHVFAGAEALGNSIIAPAPLIDSGSVTWGSTYIPFSPWTFNGSGVLCRITMAILEPSSLTTASCNLTFFNLGGDTLLLDSAANEIPFSVKNGNYTLAKIPIKLKISPAQNVFYTDQTPPGSTFVINITVENVWDLQNWQIKFSWDSTILNFTNITRPADHVFAPVANSLLWPSWIVNNGSVMWGCTYFNWDYWTFNGTGTLCQIALKILNPGATLPVSCSLSLNDLEENTFLLDGAAHDILFTEEDGNYTLVPSPNIAIPNVTLKATVGQGYSMRINVTVENCDYYLTCVFNLTLIIDTVEINVTRINATIANIFVSLAPRASRVMTVTWNTTGFSTGIYGINVFAGDKHYPPFLIVSVTIPGDVTSIEPSVPDGKVDMRDIGLLCLKFGTVSGDLRWRAEEDINDDDVVNLRDIGIACSDFGKHYP